MTTPVRRTEPTDFSWADPTGAAAAVRAVSAAATEADGSSPLDEAALLELRHRGLARSTLLVPEDDATGFAWLHEEALDLVVHPDHRRRGLGGRLLAAALAHLADQPVTAWSHGDHTGAAVLAGRNGFARVRDLWVMRLPLGAQGPLDTDQHDLPALPAPSSGVTVRTFVPGQDEDAVVALNAVAFAGHPEQGSLTRSDLDQRIHEAWCDPAGLFLAEVDGELLGFHWTKVHPGDPGHGEVYVVGVSPQAQGRGLGGLLTLTGLHHLAALGLPEIELYVESDNAPALAVYHRLGFRHAPQDTHVSYRRD